MALFSINFIKLFIALIKNFIFNPMADLKSNLHWLLVVQVILFCLYLWYRERLIYLTGWGDEPSYVLFSFDSLKEILGQHRTFGLPLILKLYSSFFNDYELIFPLLKHQLMYQAPNLL